MRPRRRHAFGPGRRFGQAVSSLCLTCRLTVPSPSLTGPAAPKAAEAGFSTSGFAWIRWSCLSRVRERPGIIADVLTGLAATAPEKDIGHAVSFLGRQGDMAIALVERHFDLVEDLADATEWTRRRCGAEWPCDRAVIPMRS